MCKRLFDVDMDAHRHREHRGGEVGVVGRADRDRIDLVSHLLEHHPEVIVDDRVVTLALLLAFEALGP